MKEFFDKLVSLGISVGGKILLALVVFIIGMIVVKGILKLIKKGKGFAKLDSTIQSFLFSFIKIILYTVLVISIISILGVPMTSLIAVLSACGLAIGLALQGALSNFAGGIMILIFKPFKVNDYIESAGAEGTVVDITVFYTKILTVDNRRITVPNGSLMNANVVNFSSEEKRRVDLSFTVAFGTESSLVKTAIMDAAVDVRILMDIPPVVVETGSSDTGREFTLRAWCKNSDYWDLRFALVDRVYISLADKGIKPATSRVSFISEKNIVSASVSDKDESDNQN